MLISECTKILFRTIAQAWLSHRIPLNFLLYFRGKTVNIYLNEERNTRSTEWYIQEFTLFLLMLLKDTPVHFDLFIDLFILCWVRHTNCTIELEKKKNNNKKVKKRKKSCVGGYSLTAWPLYKHSCVKSTALLKTYQTTWTPFISILKPVKLLCQWRNGFLFPPSQSVQQTN